MPESHLDNAAVGARPDALATSFKSLVSSSPIGMRKQAMGAKKTLLGGAK
jgi:hypothetical protein